MTAAQTAPQTAPQTAVVRPGGPGDLDALKELARLSGPGFTSLPDDEALLARRLDVSAQTFAATSNEAARGGAYMLMLEDGAGEVVGCAAVKAAVGLAKPFYNYRILTVAQASAAANRRFDLDVLVLVNEFAGATEVGSLFLKPQARGGGVGRLLAQSRYLLIAAARERFSETVIAELRGQVDADGVAPFWDHLGVKFFHMSFHEADTLSAVTDNQFILDLMPKYPIYADLLDDEARGALGRAHPDGEPARALLEWEGFRYDRVVDIFDGGPLMSAPRDQIRTVRESRRVRVRVDDGVSAQAGAASGLLTTDQVAGFRACRTAIVLDGDAARVPSATLDALSMNEDEEGRAWVRR